MKPYKKKTKEIIKKDPNEIINWYDKLKDDLPKQTKIDKNFKSHYILPNSMILSIGGTGSGKTNSLMTFLSLKNDSFYTIILYTGSTSEEPLYEYLKSKIPDMQIYTDINEVPNLTEFEDSKDKEKLIIFDDFINLQKKDMTKISEYLTAGRKFGFTVWLQAQNYVSVPKSITRNINYFIIFKLNDNTSLNTIIKNHNVNFLPVDKFKEAYTYATKEKFNFLLIDLKNDDRSKGLRHNFLGFISV